MTLTSGPQMLTKAEPEKYVFKWTVAINITEQMQEDNMSACSTYL